MKCDVIFRRVRVRWDRAVSKVTHSLVRAWESVWGVSVRGPPVGADKDGGRAIWVVWFLSKSLSAAEMRPGLLLNFHLHSQISCLFFAQRQSGRKLSPCNKAASSKVIRGNLSRV